MTTRREKPKRGRSTPSFRCLSGKLFRGTMTDTTTIEIELTDDVVQYVQEFADGTPNLSESEAVEYMVRHFAQSMVARADAEANADDAEAGDGDE